MKEVLKKMIDHPIASLFLISETTCGIARIIRAIKGDTVRQIITVNKTEPE